MKFVTILIDGMADEVIESLGNKTPLEYADIKTINEMAKVSKLGMVHTVPDGMPWDMNLRDIIPEDHR